jgi:hypothetical protein
MAMVRVGVEGEAAEAQVDEEGVAMAMDARRGVALSAVGVECSDGWAYLGHSFGPASLTSRSRYLPLTF